MNMQLMMARARINHATPVSNAIQDWFTGGGLGFWLNANSMVFSNSGGTTPAVAGDNVQLIKDLGSTHNFSGLGSSTSPILRYDSTLARNYLEFTTSSSQGLYIPGAVDSFWKALHDGTEYIVTALVQFGSIANPNALYPLLATESITASEIGMIMFYDDRSGPGFNDRARFYISPGSTPVVIDEYGDSKLTANTPLKYSVGYKQGQMNPYDGHIYVDGVDAVTGTSSSGGSPSSANPTWNPRIGIAPNSSFPSTMRLYAIAVAIGSGAQAQRAGFELAI